MSFQRSIKYLGVTVFALVLSACGGGGGGDSASTSTQTTSTSTPANSASTSGLAIVGQPSTTVTPGSTYYFNANATGGNQNSLAFSITNKPSWATFNTATGELTGTPSAAGTFAQIVVSVSDGVSTSSTQPFSIAVVDVGAVKTGSSVQLSWNAPAENVDGSALGDLSGYVVRYGTSAAALDQKISIGSAVANTYTISGLTEGQTYYFVVAAVNAQDVEGESSSTVSMQI